MANRTDACGIDTMVEEIENTLDHASIDTHTTKYKTSYLGFDVNSPALFSGPHSALALLQHQQDETP